MKEIIEILKQKNETISTMESCTGGGVANKITNIEGASEVFSFSAVTYSNDFKFPETLKEEFYIDYIRGLFDGDGSIKDTNCTPTWQIDSSSKDIIENIQQILLKYNIETKIQEKQSKNIPLYRIYCYGQKKCRKIYELLYNNAEIFMARKKEKFENLLK